MRYLEEPTTELSSRDTYERAQQFPAWKNCYSSKSSFCLKLELYFYEDYLSTSAAFLLKYL